MSKRKPPPERRKPDNQPDKTRVTPKPVKPSDDTSRDFLPPGWRRGLIPRDRKN